ncbi:CcdB family protein [Caulobacter mirabilis]|uniref:Toxin CcdB n=1 Tax=Caulobacter mirabilis TaxID=69666 RepID=A0A2D2AWC3_9CAUL|nr:CcdB family protein [Caulobacter mirabilis]ATQ42309.1 hypothetical protein CSW64_07700 [Caulobacter mirabilis]
MATLVTRQFDIIRNPDGARRSIVPYILVLQSHYAPMATTIVAPIRRKTHAEGHAEIEVPISVQNEDCAVMVAELAHLPSRMLGRSIDNLSRQEDDIRRALDRLFTGF